MIDERTLKNILSLDPQVVEQFKDFAEAAKVIAAQHGCKYIGISGHRTWKEQNNLYAIGRTRPGKIVTNAKGGYSNHNFGIAMDFGVFQDGKYLDNVNPKLASKVHKAVGKIASVYGLDWGGKWKFVDEPHFEVATGLTLAEKRARYIKNGTVFNKT